MSRAIMIDIETLDTAVSAVVTQVAVLAFDTKGGEGDFMSVHLNVSNQLQAGRTISPDTIKWWLETNPDLFIDSLTKPVTPLKSVFESLTEIYEESGASEVWANGTDFDIAILKQLSTQAEVSLPWPYYQARDLRTVKQVIGYKRNQDHMESILGDVVEHDAYDDCRIQVYDTQECIRNINKALIHV